MSYPDIETALGALRDPHILELVGSVLLLDDYPGLEWTGGPGDRGRDAVVREGLFGGELVVVQFSLETKWSGKVGAELARYDEDPSLPRSMVFLSSRTTGRVAVDRRCREAAERDVKLRVLGRQWLVPRLEDHHRELAERHLRLAPRRPRRLVDAATYADRLVSSVPGFRSPLVGADVVLNGVRAGLDGPGIRAVLLVGKAGSGKTRLALEASPPTAVTLVLTPGARLDGSVLGEVPVQRPVVLIVDDAHRISGELGELRTLLDDPRWAETRVLCTLRPGHEETVVEAIRLAPGEMRSVALGDLRRAEIDQLLQSPPHRIRSEALRGTIVHLAQGNPLVAHLAADAARHRGLGAAGAGEVLRSYRDRLLAVLPSDLQRDVLAVIAAIGPLPTDDLQVLQAALPGVGLWELRAAVYDLADAGVLLDSGGVVLVKPDRLAPVIVADVYFPEQGLPRLRYEDAVQPLLGTPRRGAVLEVLAEAAWLSAGRGREVLRRLVVDQWPGVSERRAGVWSEALGEGRAVAPGLPHEVGALLERFCRVEGLEASRGRYVEVQPSSALDEAARTAVALAPFDLEVAVDRLLTLVLLGGRAGERASEGPEQELRRLMTEGVPDRPHVPTELGLVAVGTIREWLAGRQGADAAAVAARAAGLLVRVTNSFTYMSSHSASTVTWGHFSLPRTDEHRRLVLEASTLVASAVGRLGTTGQLAALDRMRAWLRDRPQSAAAPDPLMAEAAGAVASAFTARWHNLPTGVRHRLTRLAGDLADVAARAEGDQVLALYAALYDVPEGERETREERVRDRVRELVGELSVPDGVERLAELAEAAEEVGTSWGLGAGLLARELGARATTAEAVEATRLLMSGAGRRLVPSFLSPAVAAHGSALHPLLQELAADREFATAVVPLLEVVDPDFEQELLDTLDAVQDREVLATVAEHLGHCPRLPAHERARRLLSTAERATGETLAEILSVFGSDADNFGMVVPEEFRESFVAQMRRVACSPHPAGSGPYMAGAWRAVAGLGATVLLDLVETRLECLLGHGGQEWPDMVEDLVVADMGEALSELDDEGVRRVAEWVERYGDDERWWRVQDDVWELFAQVGRGRPSHLERLLAWAGGGERERSLAIRGLCGTFGTDAFDAVAPVLLRSGLSEIESSHLLWAAALHDVRVGLDPAPWLQRIEYFRQWREADALPMRRFAEQALKAFEARVGEDEHRGRALEEGY